MVLLDAGFTALDPIKVAQVGGTSLALSLMIVLIALWRGWLELGPAARREVEFWQTYARQGWAERDAYRTQVEQRQSVVDQALELARVLKNFQHARRLDPPDDPDREPSRSHRRGGDDRE